MGSGPVTAGASSGTSTWLASSSRTYSSASARPASGPASPRVAARAGGAAPPRAGAGEHCLEIIAVLDGDGVVSAALAVAAVLVEVDAPGRPVEAGVGPAGQPVEQGRLALERLGEADEVLHVQPGVPPVTVAAGEGQPGVGAEGAGGAA